MVRRVDASPPPTAPAIHRTVQKITNTGIPARLKIPRIKVDTAVDSMGLTKNGEMQAPSGARTVGWFALGPHPGNIGSAVIDGHFGRWKDGEESVFNDLHLLTEGDKIYVQDQAGVTTAFVVREARVYKPDQDASAVFSSNDSLAHLNLITCEGTWREAQKTYSNRLVVYADAVTQ